MSPVEAKVCITVAMACLSSRMPVASLVLSAARGFSAAPVYMLHQSMSRGDLQLSPFVKIIILCGGMVVLGGGFCCLGKL